MALSLPRTLEPWLKLCPVGEAGHRRESYISLSKGTDFICNSVWKFKTKDILKNSGSFGERLPGENWKKIHGR